MAAIIIVTLLFNLQVRRLNAEQLGSSILLSNVIQNVDLPTESLVEEGPSTTATSSTIISYRDQGVISDSAYPNDFAAPDTDNDDVYATTEGENAILAPVITDTQTPGTARRIKIETYLVQQGDTIGSIAQKFAISITTVLWQNNLSATTTIRPGQQLSILPTTGLAYTIKKGDTLKSIANRYQGDPDTITEFNHLASITDIHVGETLVVPNGVKPTVVVERPRIVKNIPDVIRDIFVPSTPAPDNGTQLLWPLLSHRITQYFHFGHSAIDVGDKIGNPIYAAESGRVIYAGWSTGYGNNVRINHGNGLVTLYGHSSKLLVAVGDIVERGQIIALIGSTGRSTGPHLHFEVQVNGRKTNPLSYVR